MVLFQAATILAGQHIAAQSISLALKGLPVDLKQRGAFFGTRSSCGAVHCRVSFQQQAGFAQCC
jgi:hypothetical protein